MTNHTETHQLQTNLTLQTPHKSPLTIHALTITLTKQNETIISTNLTFQIPTEIYQIIDTQSLFNLKPELRETLTAGLFKTESNIEITAILKPDFLPHLTSQITNLPTYIKNLNQQQPNHPLLSTENWLALQVKQEEIGYRTFWDYLPPSTITADNIDGEKLNHALINFCQDSTLINLETIGNQTIADAIGEIIQGFEEWIDTTLDNISGEAIGEAIESIAKTWWQLADANPPPKENLTQIFPKILEFFTSDDWDFRKIQGATILEMAFIGKNAQFTCHAETLEEKSQFVFYSICPIAVPKPKLRALAEFTSIANYGTIIGNFELDFTAREIRYKTQTKVYHSLPISDQIKDLVYTNIWMMEQYLPGIISVINGEASASEAIRLIEERESSTSASSNNLSYHQTPANIQTKKVESQSSLPTESLPPLPQQPTESKTFRRLSLEEILKLRDCRLR